MERPLHKEVKTNMELLAVVFSQVRVILETELELEVHIMMNVNLYTRTR